MTESTPTGLRRPARLRPGDRVAVVAPAGVVDADALAAGVGILRSWGLGVHVGRHTLDRNAGLPYLAGTDSDRAADLQTAWCDPDVAGVLCARGGYGSLRIVDALDWSAMAAATPKVFVGSSDVTALHSALNNRLGVATIYGPMVATAAFTTEPAPAGHLRRMLFEPGLTRVLSGPDAGPLIPGRATGRTVGGNLSLISSSLGVPGLPLPTPGSIGLLEDVNEAAYRVDHFVTHLLRAGWFDRMAAVALGSWDRCGDPAEVRAVLAERLTPLGIPVLWELGFGHGPVQLSVPLGAVADLDAAAGTLTLRESPLV